MKLKNFSTPQVKFFLMLVFGSLLLTALLHSFPFYSLEAKLYDVRMRWTFSRGESPPITLVTIDEKSVSELDEFAPFPLPLHLAFLERIAALSPKAVGFLVSLNQVQQAAPEYFQDRTATRFIEVIRAMEQLGISVLFGTHFDVTGEVLPPYPMSGLDHALAIIHRDGPRFADDKVTRRSLAEISTQPSFHLLLAWKMGFFPDKAVPAGTFRTEELNASYSFIRYPGNIGRTGSPFRVISFVDILKDRVSREEIKDQIVLVGTRLRDHSQDFAITPVYGNARPRPKLEVHANILSSFLKDNAVKPVPRGVDWFITFLLILLVAARVLYSSPVAGLIATLGLAGGVFLAGVLVFQDWWGVGGYWLLLAHPLVGTFLSYYLVVPYCLIREYEGRWELERQAQIREEIEELKTNFLFLITHDLKTPVAKIQGLAEMLTKKAADRLVERDLLSLRQITESTEELNHFITSILELHSVESNELKPKFESKDINALIEKAIESHRVQAKNKGIEIELKLEPLFPVQIDPTLMLKVLNNLLSNAIQYSQSGSTVTVESREKGDSIEIGIQDQGAGLTEEEKSNLFTRFYRAKNEVTAKTRGTGLGLYLSKFFVEAHHGVISVESETGIGSTFLIQLPQSQKKNS